MFYDEERGDESEQITEEDEEEWGQSLQYETASAKLPTQGTSRSNILLKDLVVRVESNVSIYLEYNR